MNGVRRFLGGGGGKAADLPPPPPPSDKSGGLPSPINTTMPLFSNRAPGAPNWPPITPVDGSWSPQIQSSVYSPTSPATPSGLKSLPRVPPPPMPREYMDEILSPTSSNGGFAPTAPLKFGGPPRAAAPMVSPQPPPPLVPRQTNGIPPTQRPAVMPISSPPTRGLPEIDMREEMLISLLASDAVIDSKNMQVLSFEEVEDLKKEQQVLSSRVQAQAKKLALETKIRDAALSLQNLNSSSSKQTSDKVDAANRKVDVAQRELHRISERANEVSRRLLEHRTAVLSLSLRALEAKRAGATATDHSIFTGAHLFAGNDDAVMLDEQHLQSSTLVQGLQQQLQASRDHEAELQQQLQAAKDHEAEVQQQLQAAKDREVELQEQLLVPKDREAELQRDLELVTMDKDDLELALREKLNTANERIESLEAKLADARDTSDSQEELEELKATLEAERAQWRNAREEWDTQRAQLEEEKMDDLARLQEEHEEQRAEDSKWASEYAEARNSIQALVTSHDIDTPTTVEPSLATLIASVVAHVDDMARRLEEASGERDQLVESSQRLERQLETARKDSLDSRTRSPPALSMSPPPALIMPPMPPPAAVSGDDTDLDRVLQALRAVWPMLPSPDARARKTGLKASSPMRPKSPSSPGSLEAANSSLSDLDVRQLKALYDPRNAFPSPGVMNEFSVDALVERVHALLVDDRALIERLIRFAKSHEHLRTNAERAQKIAQESTMGLEMYAKQVKALEEHSSMLTGRTTELTNELAALDAQLRDAATARQSAEKSAKDLSDMCRTLREANEGLSARAAAADGAPSPAQVTDLTKRLRDAEDELDRYRMVQETQRIALLDELNELQTNNAKLRDQLRSRK